MKQRLKGLLALMLCLMLTATPFSSACANVVHITSGNDNVQAELWGSMIIGSGLSLNMVDDFSLSGGTMITEEIHYYPNGLRGENAKAEKDGFTNGKHTVRSASQTADYEANRWFMMLEPVNHPDNDQQGDHHDIHMERLNKVISEIEVDESLRLWIMDGLQSWDCDSELSLSEREAKLKAAAQNWKAGSAVDFYQMQLLYETNIPGLYELVSDDMSRSLTLTLPYPEGYNYENSTDDDFCLLHLNHDGEIEFLNLRRTLKGLVAEAECFSPYAVAYMPTSSGSENMPQTGDSSQLALWIALAFISLAGAAYFTMRRREHN